MIRQFGALCRLKELREERLLLRVEAARREIRDAEIEHQAAVRIAAENARALPVREKAIYAELIGRVEKPDRFELAMERVQRLEREQQRLDDRVREAEQEVSRLQEALNVLREMHRRSRMERDKYRMTRRDLEREANFLLEAKEEAEQEEAAAARFMATA